MNQKILCKNLQVVELASILAGPSVGMFFSEMGAKVIKIENEKVGGDPSRRWHNSEEDPSRLSAYYISTNYNKEVVFCNLSDPIDLNRVKTIIQKSDIIITNLKKTSLEKYGLTYSACKKLNPKIIYGWLLGYMSKEKPAFDIVLQAETGILSMTGQKGKPAKLPVAYIDVLAAHQLKEGLLLALWQKALNDRGYFVKVSLEESALTSFYNQSSNVLNSSFEPNAMGTLHPNIAPYGEVIHLKSKQIVLAVGTDLQFDKLATILQLSLIHI